MECNKEEAYRAKEVAEKKMESRDFAGARKVALMAQRLDPDLKDIHQMILVCDVHGAAQDKFYGVEKDWYGILQVEPMVDEAAIKKQYRKFALLLHPDKNQFPGASDAFKLIGEAQKVLLDNHRRAAFDSKRKSSGRVQVSNWATQQGSRQSNSRSHPWFQKNLGHNTAAQSMDQRRQQPNLQTQQVPHSNQPTFWTVCPFCSVRYQYYKDVVNKNVRCQSCKKEFIAYEISSTSLNTGIVQPKASQDQRAVHQGHFTPIKLSSKASDQGRLNPESLQRNPCSETIKEPNGNNPHKNGNIRSRNDRKKRSVSAKSSESFETESSKENGEDMIIKDGDTQPGKRSGYDIDKNLRRSARFRQQVPYNENLTGDDELLKPSKKAKSSQVVDPAVVHHLREDNTQQQADMTKKDKEAPSFENNLQERETKSVGSEKFSLSGDVKTSSASECFEYPDPDFNDFDQLRQVGAFSPGQLWTIYDDLDGMPRFYAIIKKVMSPVFKVRITWLEPDPDDEDKIKWISAGLPTSCGKFKLGDTEDSEDHGIFSHLANWERPNGRNMYTVYPRKGEIWAIFKDWDVNWYSTLSDKKYYEFEFVEVLADYADDIGVRVCYLAKIKGFTCLFCRTVKEGRDFHVLPARHIFRFSHKVPAFRMSGEEGKNIPAGSFELDPASLPVNHDTIQVFENLSMDTGEVMLNDCSSRFSADILKAKHDLNRDESPTQFVEPKEEFVSDAHASDLGHEAKSGNKVCLADEVRSERRASLEDSKKVNVEYPGIGYMTQEREAVHTSQKVDLKFDVGNLYGRAEEQDAHKSCGEAADGSPSGIGSSVEATSEGCPLPDQDFHNFDSEKTFDKFKVGQIWAIYCDEDTLPKYYCHIKRIDSPPEFGLYVTWLASCSTSKDMIRWVDKKMPISCGNFKLGKKRVMRYGDTNVFSHEIKVQSTKGNHVYTILPQTGDIWALYKSWSEKLTCLDLASCEYEIVEVLEKNEAVIKVMVLEKVGGYRSVFRPQIRGNSKVTMVIPYANLLRFSHQVPAVRLSEEKEGSLRGFWETDTAALPAYLFSSN